MTHNQTKDASLSFADKRRSQSWLRRQFSRQMSQDYDSSTGGEYPIAVAAAAFAIKSLEETKMRDGRKGNPDTPITKIKKKDDKARVPEPRAKAIKFAGGLQRRGIY